MGDWDVVHTAPTADNPWAVKETKQADDTPSMGEILNQGDQGGVDTTRQVGLIGRGAIKGATSLATLPTPAEGIQKAINFVKKHAFGMETEETGDETRARLIDKGLTAAGFPQASAPGEGALENTANLIGGALVAPGGGVPGKATADLPYSRLSGPTGGQNVKIINSMLAREIGEDGATNIKPNVLGRAFDRVKATMDAVESPEHVLLADPAETHAAIAGINAEHTPADMAVWKNNTVQRLLGTLAKGHTDAEELGSISHMLGKTATTKFATDYEQGAGLAKVKDYVDSLIQEGMEPGQQAVYQQARNQYRTLVALEKPGMVNRATGDVDVGKFASHLEREDPVGFSQGKNGSALYNALRASQSASTAAIPSLGYHSKLMLATKAALRLGPQAAQTMVNEGLQPGLRALANKPGFMSALAEELSQQDQEQGK